MASFSELERLSKEQAGDLSAACLRNARELVDSAKVLAEPVRESERHAFFGYATALLALAQEEYVKAVLFAAVSSGSAVISRKSVRGAFPLHPSTFLCHACKNEQAAGSLITDLVTHLRLGDTPTIEQKLKLSEEIINTPLPVGDDRFLRGMGVPPEHLEAAKSYYLFVSSLSGLKETGLYVDTSEDGPRSPAQFPQAIYRIAEGIVAPVVLANDPLEAARDPARVEGAKHLLPAAEEEITPEPCPHKGLKRRTATIEIRLRSRRGDSS